MKIPRKPKGVRHTCEPHKHPRRGLSKIAEYYLWLSNLLPAGWRNLSTKLPQQFVMHRHAHIHSRSRSQTERAADKRKTTARKEQIFSRKDIKGCVTKLQWKDSLLLLHSKMQINHSHCKYT